MLRKIHRKYKWLLSIACLVIFFAGFAVGRSLAVRHIHIPLSASKPLKLAVLADFHIDSTGKNHAMTRKAIGEAMGQDPDAILLIGDFVGERGGIQHLPSLFNNLHAPLGVYAVLGNHDHWADAKAVQKALEAEKIRVLDNESVELRKEKERIFLVGIDDLWAGKVSWEQAFRDVPKDAVIILLSHNPDAARYREGQQAQLILSAHTHAGQIWTPYFFRWAMSHIVDNPLPTEVKSKETNGDNLRREPWKIVKKLPGARRVYQYGLKQEPWGWVYITSGVTPGFAPPRWFTRPEVAVVELQ